MPPGNVHAMELTGLLVFSAAYSIASASPGPGVAAVVARVLTAGPSGIVAYIAGFVLGDLIWFTVAATGLAVVASTFAILFIVIKYLGAAYLLYLAYKLWTAPAQPVTAADARPEGGARLFITGLALTLGNPKVIVFFLALLPTVVDLRTLTATGFAEIALLIATILSAVLATYAAVAARARRLLASPRAIRHVNRGSSIAMAGAAVTIASR